MNFFWMWSIYPVAYALASLLIVSCGLILAFTERVPAQLCTSGANVAWAFKDIFWMLENGKAVPSGLVWASWLFGVTLAFTLLAFVLGGLAGTLDAVVIRLRRIRSVFTT